MENYLYLAVMGFGVTQTVTVSGIFMILTSIALGGTGLALRRLGQVSWLLRWKRGAAGRYNFYRRADK